MKKGTLMGIVLLTSLSANSGEVDIYGLNFNAPTVNGKGNVNDPRVGEIIFDASDDTFYGNTDGEVTLVFQPFVARFSQCS